MNFDNKDLSQETIDWVGRAEAVVPVILGALGRIESERRVSKDVIDAMHEAELFRMCLPRSMGGGEADLLTVMLTTETIAAADASTAWCLGQGLGCSRSSGYLDPAAAREVFGKPGSILAWGPPDGKAEAVVVEGGFRVTGKWRFASGIPNATWVGPHCQVIEPDGSPRLGDNGKPVHRTVLLPKTSATVTDVWQVIGLRGTGSNSFAVDDLFVPAAFSFARDAVADRREDGLLYRMPLTTFYGVAFAGVALGIARTVFESFLDLARDKTPSHNVSVLRENPAVQRQVAQAEANLGSARAYLIHMITSLWNSGLLPHEWPLEERARLRIASTNAVCQARDTVSFAYQAAGSSAIFESNPFERRFRDMNTVAQQAQGQPINFEHAGTALLGLEVMGGRV